MKKLLIIPVTLMLISCSSGGNKEARLEEYKKKVEDYNARIESLEAELAAESVEESAERLPVEVKQLRPETFSRSFEVRGSMEAVSEAFISPEINGQIRELAVSRGQTVQKGDLLVRLNTDVTEKSIEEIRTSLELARKVFEKQEELWEKQIGSEIQYLEARNNVESLEARLATLQQQLELAEIKAPFKGIIEDIMVKQGELASPGMPMLHLVNLDRMRIRAQISESYLNSVARGDLVEVRFPSYPEMILKEPISRLGEVIDAQTRTFSLEVELNNPSGKLKPNMLTVLMVKDFEAENALVVQSVILREDFRGNFLFLAGEGSEGYTARKTYVEPGVTVQDRTMINAGLKEGDLVITRGYNLIADQMPIRIAE